MGYRGSLWTIFTIEVYLSIALVYDDQRADPLQAAANHGVVDGPHGAGDHGHPPHDPPLTRQGGLQGFAVDDFLNESLSVYCISSWRVKGGLGVGESGSC